MSWRPGLAYASTGNSKTTSLLVSDLYTLEKVSSFVSTFTKSLGSRNTYRKREEGEEGRDMLMLTSRQG